MPAPLQADHYGLWLRTGLAFVWLATGLGVLHPYYRELGVQSLAPLGLPAWVMVATCVGEVVLALWVLSGRGVRWACGLQGVLILGFSGILAATQPQLFLHPFGVLTKNLALLAIIGVVWLLDRRGWDRRTFWLLRVGMAVVWLTDGVAAAFLYGPYLSELDGLPTVFPASVELTLRIAGALSLASGAAALALSGRPRCVVLGGQMCVLATVLVVMSYFNPLLWVHPFGPLTKNVPLLIGTWIVLRRSASGNGES